MKNHLYTWCWRIFYAYLFIGILFYFLQDYLLFHPLPINTNQPYNYQNPHQEIIIPINKKDTLHLIDILPSDKMIKRGVVLYFHGNKKNISWYQPYMPYFTKNGYEVLMIDYPGFGKSRGILTEEKIYTWAKMVYNIANQKFSADSIVIYGKSMGTGIAAQLASIRQCKRVILETPYYNFSSVVQHFLPIYPISLLIHYQFPTNEYFENIHVPISLIHGTNDGVISYQNSIQLLPLIKNNAELITINGGSHNNLFTYKKTIEKLDSLLTH